MNLFCYYVLHTIKNSIKKIFRTWLVWLVVFIVGCGVVGGIVGIVVYNSVDKDTFSQEEIEQEENEMTAEDRETVINIVEMVVGGLILCILLYSIYSGDKSGTSIFTMPDVNLMFSAPLKPQFILMFRVILQMALILMSSIYMAFQIPNLSMNLGLSALVTFIILFTWILILIFGKLICVCTYTIVATKQKLRRFVLPLIIAILSIITVAYTIAMYLGKTDPYTTAVEFFNSKASRYIPIWGWLKGFVMYAIEGDYVASMVCLFGIIVSYVLLIYIIWHIKADFYEDAFNNANKRQELITAYSEGRRIGKERKNKMQYKEIGKGQGAMMFFIKSVYNRRRTAKFGILTNTAITNILICFSISMITKFLLEKDSITMLGLIMLMAIFFRNYGSPIAYETGYNFIYMIPESATKKLAYSLLAGIYDSFMNILPGFLLATIIIGVNPITCLFWIILFSSLDFISSSTGLIIDMLIPSFITLVVKSLLQFSLKMIAIIPTVIIMIIASSTSSLLAGIIISSIANIIIAFGLFMLSPRFLHTGRK